LFIFPKKNLSKSALSPLRVDQLSTNNIDHDMLLIAWRTIRTIILKILIMLQ